MGRLSEEIAGVLALTEQGYPPERIGKMFARSTDWVERQLELSDQIRRTSEVRERQEAARSAARALAWKAAQAKGRESRKAKIAGKSVKVGDGRVVRAFLLWGDGNGAAVSMGDRLLFVETGSARLEPGQLVDVVPGVGVYHLAPAA